MSDKGSQIGEANQQSEWSGKPCPHCGSNDIVSKLELGVTGMDEFGITYKINAFFTGNEKLHAEICLACGTVVRIFVVNSKRNWIVT
ncbi:MAG: hypothetical protein ABSC48_09450 [Terracidiphilus sp.]